MGSYLLCDDKTLTKVCMDVARINIRRCCLAMINETLIVSINGFLFWINMVEELLSLSEVQIDRREEDDESGP